MTAKPKLLLVDDDPDIHNFIQHELSDSAFDLFSAYDAKEAIELLGNHQFALGLIDIVLGTHETSDKLIQFFKEDLAGANQHLPMAIMSAHMDETYAKKIRLKGPTVFAALRKPLRPKQVLSLLDGSSKPSILVIHPSLDFLRDLKNDFDKSEFQLFTSHSVEQAQGLIDSIHFVAIVIEHGSAKEEAFESFSELSRERYNPPYVVTGVDHDQELEDNNKLLIFDFIEDPLQKGELISSIEKIKRWQESDEEDQVMISGVTENMTEEETTVKGLEESLHDDKEVISGSEAPDEGAQLVKGEKEDLADENIMVKGSGSAEIGDESSTTIKGEREDIGEEFWTVKNIGHENINVEESEFDPNKRNQQGVTPLMASCYLGELEQVQEMIGAGGDPRLRAKNGKTLVHFAAFSGNPELVKFLISDQGLKPGERDIEKREPMYDAIKGDNVEVVQALIDLGARYNRKMDGKSYLAIATLRGSSTIMEKFLSLGLSATEKDYDGKSCLDYIQKMGRKDLAEIVKKYL